jgi:hypothetical protein
MGFMKEVMMGDRKDPKIIKARINLPTTLAYDNISPWVSKRMSNGVLAVDFFTYMDDM